MAATTQIKEGTRKNRRDKKLLFARQFNSAAIADARSQFILTALGLPEASYRLAALFDEATMQLAARDLESDPSGQPSTQLETRIQLWAVGCNLAAAPVRDWWIFNSAVAELRHRLDLGEVEMETIGWPVSLDISPPMPDISPFQFEAWDPCFESEDEFRLSVESALTDYLAEVSGKYELAGFRPAITRRDDMHFRWLVRHQILGHTFSDIADTNGHQTSPGTVKTAIVRLRKMVHLPARSPGRPRKR